MITYLVGNPGSGKTYYAVFMIYQIFLFEPKKTFLTKFVKPKEKPNYSYCYTNINEFKFELSDKFKKFDFDEFYLGLRNLYALYKTGATDNEVNEKAKELNLYGCVFVLDECHNFFKDKKDEILVWWLTYHRHLYQDIYLITQDLTLVNNEYKRIAEKFYRAVDSSRRLFSKKFRYEVYASYRLYKKDQLEIINIPFLQEVFDLYHSGQSSNKKSFVRFYFLLAIVIFILLIFYFYFVVVSIFRGDTSEPEKNIPADEKIHVPASQTPASSSLFFDNKKPKDNNIDIPEIYIYDITCLNNNCHFSDDYHLFPLSLISYISSTHTPLYFYFEPKTNELVKYYYVFDKPVFANLIQKNNKGVSDEKFNQIPNSSVSAIK
jgi:hypothetical protein